MAKNQLRYYQQYNKLRDQGVSHEEAHRRATKFAGKKKESKIRRLARLMKMAVLGRHYKSDLQRRLEQRQLKTVRTKAVTKGLKGAGLTEAEIRRLRGR